MSSPKPDGLERAKLMPSGRASEAFEVHFNPESLQYDLANRLRADDDSGAATQNVQQSTAKLSLELVWDTTQDGTDVRNDTRKVMRLMRPGTDQTPPVVAFEWGSFKFEGFIESYKEVIDYFSASGVPLRSTTTLVLAQNAVNWTATLEDTTDTVEVNPAFEVTPTEGRDLGSAAHGGADPGGDTGRGVGEDNGVGSLRRPGAGPVVVGAAAGAGIGLSAAAGVSAGAAFGAGAGFGVGGTAGFQAGVGLGGQLALGAGASAGASIGFGASAGASAGFGASAGASAGFGASAGASAGFGASAGASAGFGASAGASAGFGASAGASAGFGASAGASAGFGASAGASAGFGASAGASAGFGASAGAFAGAAAGAGAFAGASASASASAGWSASAGYAASAAYAGSSAAGASVTGSAAGSATGSAWIGAGAGYAVTPWTGAGAVAERFAGLRLGPRPRGRAPDPAELLRASLGPDPASAPASSPTRFLPGGRSVATGSGISADTQRPFTLRAAVRIDEDWR